MCWYFGTKESMPRWNWPILQMPRSLSLEAERMVFLSCWQINKPNLKPDGTNRLKRRPAARRETVYGSHKNNRPPIIARPIDNRGVILYGLISAPITNFVTHLTETLSPGAPGVPY